jgi:hypothetical protein
MGLFWLPGEIRAEKRETRAGIFVQFADLTARTGKPGLESLPRRGIRKKYRIFLLFYGFRLASGENGLYNSSAKERGKTVMIFEKTL